MKRNRRYVDSSFGADLTIAPSVPGYLASLLTESETSGGLLFSVAPDRAPSVIDAFRRRGEDCWEIGSVLADTSPHAEEPPKAASRSMRPASAKVL